jgi:hypothetical protein
MVVAVLIGTAAAAQQIANTGFKSVGRLAAGGGSE